MAAVVPGVRIALGHVVRLGPLAVQLHTDGFLMRPQRQLQQAWFEWGDLLSCAFGVTRCLGKQCWHMQPDPGRSGRPAVEAALRESIDSWKGPGRSASEVGWETGSPAADMQASQAGEQVMLSTYLPQGNQVLEAVEVDAGIHRVHALGRHFGCQHSVAPRRCCQGEQALPSSHIHKDLPGHHKVRAGSAGPGIEGRPAAWASARGGAAGHTAALQCTLCTSGMLAGAQGSLWEPQGLPARLARLGCALTLQE